jgi:hypothetical protein
MALRIRGYASVSTLVAVPACVVGLALALSDPAAAKHEDMELAKTARIEQRPDGARAGSLLARSGVVDDSVARRFRSNSNWKIALFHHKNKDKQGFIHKMGAAIHKIGKSIKHCWQVLKRWVCS